MQNENDIKPVRVAFYIRVSTEEQVKNGYSITTQTEALRDLVIHKSKHNNWIHEEGWIFKDEGFSGGDLNRPGYKALIEQVKANKFDIVVVWKIDRLSRNLTHLLTTLETLQAHNTSFYSLKEAIDFSGPIGRLTFQIFGALAEFERETFKLRSVEGKITSAKLGNYIGNGIPYGYKKVPNKKNLKGSTLAIVKSEETWVKRIFDSFVFERENYEEIARELNEKSVPKGIAGRHKDKGSPWRGNTIRGILENPTYTGSRIERLKDPDGFKHEIVVPVPAIIPQTIFIQAQSIMEDITANKKNRGGGKNVYMLSRKIVDKSTGRNFVGYRRAKGGAGYRRKGFVKGGTKYRNLEIPAEALEEYVWNHVRLAINHPKKFFKIYKQQTISDTALKKALKKQEEAQKGIEENERKIVAINHDYYDGNISERELRNSGIS